jgi:O-antigen/teichoic acid export membrane protein
LVERLVNLVVQVWLYQYLIKRISPADYSVYPVVTALLVFVPPLLAVLTSGLARDTVEAHARNDDRRVTEITSTIFPVLLAGAVGLALLALVITKYLGFVLKIAPGDLPEARVMVLLLFGSLALRLALLPFGVGLYVREKFVVTNTLIMLQTVIRTALLFFLLLGAGPRVLWVVVASVAADVAILLVTTVLSVQALPAQKFRLDCIRWELLPGLMAFGFWNMIGSIGAMIRKSSDLLILNRFATPIDVNTFQLASLTDNQIDMAVSKIMEPLQPYMVARHTTGGPSALQALCIRGGRYSLWITLLVATPLIAFRQQLWSLYLGSQLRIYPDVSIVMVLLLIRYWIEMPICLIGQAAYAMNRIRTLSVLVITSSVFNLAITIYFVHLLRMGAVGSALGTLISVLVWSLFVMWKFTLDLLRLEFGPWFKATVWRGVLPSVIAGFCGLGWRYLVAPNSMPGLLFATALVVLVYVLSILLFCLDEEERNLIKDLRAKFSSQRACGLAGRRLKSLISPLTTK